MSSDVEPIELNHLEQSKTPVWFQSQDDTPILSTLENDPTHDALAVDPPSQKQAWWQPALDWLMHGNPILRVAIAILMIGVVLLLRFAKGTLATQFEYKIIGNRYYRRCIDCIWLLFEKKNALFAVALQGAGLAIIFLTLIFAHHYAVIANLSIASVGFAVLLLITVALSLKQNAVYLSMLALSMAYLAPLLIPQSHPDSVFLLSYYLMINLAVAAMNFIKPWKILNQIAFSRQDYLRAASLLSMQIPHNIIRLILFYGCISPCLSG